MNNYIEIFQNKELWTYWIRSRVAWFPPSKQLIYGIIIISLMEPQFHSDAYLHGSII